MRDYTDAYMMYHLEGLPALLVAVAIFSIFFYVFIYLPFKFVTKLLAHAKHKADKVLLLQQNVVIAEYEPPAGLSPAEVGYLYDTKLNAEELYGTIVDLQQRGLVMLDDNRINAVKPSPPDMPEFDRHIIGWLSEHENQVITRPLLKREAVKSNLVMNRLLRESGYLLSFTEQAKRSFMRLGIIMVALFILFPVLAFRPHTIGGVEAIIFFFIFTWPGYFIFAAVLYSTASKIAGEPWLGSPKLKAIWPEIEGFRHFIELTEQQQLKFESTQTEQNIKDKNLPYAIALGIDTGMLEKLT